MRSSDEGILDEEEEEEEARDRDGMVRGNDKEVCGVVLVVVPVVKANAKVPVAETTNQDTIIFATVGVKMLRLALSMVALSSLRV